MSEDMEKNIPELDEQLEIFGQSKSREEIKAEKRAEKAAQRAAAKVAAAEYKAKKKTMPKEKRTDLLAVTGILVAVVLLCGVALGVQFAKEKKQAKFERDETIQDYFLYTDAESELELADDGITAAVYQAYYTNGGYLAVEMILGNGTASEQHLTAISVKLSNGDTEELIASGKTTDVSENYTIPAGGKKPYTLYISPEHVVIKDDPLSTISYTITADGMPVGTPVSTGGTTTTTAAE
ncbi:MAG: hypothetical protein IJ518_00300 [Clostridia bacterium]|nr:hypothetical protein [Clostridia bacterium]